MSEIIQANPYVGPRSFDDGEGARFFGRERELEELFHLLLARRLVLLHAPSGAGKS
jgi:ATP/maltotriose-dependent transcriptional regulator MalT